MFTNLNQPLKSQEISKEDYDVFLSQRSAFGISDYDITNFIEYVDEVVYNSLKKIVYSEHIPENPKFISRDEWLSILFKAYDISKTICTLNEKKVYLGIKDFKDKSEYTDWLDNTKAELFALREQLFSIINEYSDYIYII